MWIPVVRVVEGGEPPVFKQFFREWPEEGTSYENIAPTSPISHVGGVAHVEQTTFDASTLHDPSKQTDSQWCPDNGSGDIKIWVVKEDLELGEYPEHAYGMFFGGDCYVMLYTYNDERGKENYIVYFWQVSQKEREGGERGRQVLHYS
ncbi:PREDICTED: adseverin-like [Priapulus caudatus]|uniref:Adseverin-like n=1 Tax=Priapulus caudatus TaxID=37621 RepID=A0ABM1EJD9_PRICU|nr:PREDICTED: adseverin-like [Priapulus caudatus]